MRKDPVQRNAGVCSRLVRLYYSCFSCVCLRVCEAVRCVYYWRFGLIRTDSSAPHYHCIRKEQDGEENDQLYETWTAPLTAALTHHTFLGACKVQ